jgi:hypothetical protein
VTLRAGSYDVHKPDWRGCVRQDGYGWYRCQHHHEHPRAARACADAALPALKQRDHQDPAAPMPEGWEVIPRPAR